MKRLRTKDQIVNDIETNTKYCPDCDTRMSMDLFSIARGKPDGHMSRCTSCDLKAQAKWRQDNPIKARVRDRKKLLRGTYGISQEDYDSMLKSQGGVCKVCGRTQDNGRAKNLCVDHCHTTGRVRGLLCSHCNLSIGKMDDDPERLRRAANYLEAECH